MLTRRDLMKLGIAGTGYVVLGPDGNVSFADEGSLPPSPHLTPFVTELPRPLGPLGANIPDARPVSPITDANGNLSTPFEHTPHDYDKYIDARTTRFHAIVAKEQEAFLHPHLNYPTRLWGYCNRDPDPDTQQMDPPHVMGPTFKLLYGGLGPPRGRVPIGGGALVRHINGLPAYHNGFGDTRTTVHLHGGHHPARSDGFPGNIDNRPADFPCLIVTEPVGYIPGPHEPICAPPPQGRHVLDYYYPVLDPGELDLMEGRSNKAPETFYRPSTLWYHDHLLDFTGPNAYRGLAGFVLAFDDIDRDDEDEDVEGALRLPSGLFDIPLAIQDKRIDSNGQLVFSAFDHDGFLGDQFLVNGAIQPFLKVKRRKYRFRFLNASNARLYRLYLRNASGKSFPMDQIANEGGLFTRPIREITNFMIAMAERVEVVVDFSKPPFSDEPDGAAIYVENRLAQNDGRRPEDGLRSRGDYLLQFILDGPPERADPSQVPDVLRWHPQTIDQSVLNNAVRRQFRFDRSHGAWTINGQLAGHLEKPIARSKLRQPEIWRLENNSGGWWHPIHIHCDFFRVLSRNGKEPPLAERFYMGNKDTILLRDNESVEVLIEFTDHPGPYVFHCHNMEHEDMAMMARLDVVL